MGKIKILHIITGLNGGGAETMLFKILQYTNREAFDVEVISMMDEGVFGHRIREELNIPVYTLNLNRGSISLAAILKSREICKKADIIQTWMYHANLFGFIIAKILSSKKLIWGLHHSNLSPDRNKKSTIFFAKLGGILSPFVDTVISCGKIVKDVHVQFGYSEKNNVIIPNGFDVELFNKENIQKTADFVDSTKKYLLHVARWDPLKDYDNLLKSIALLSEDRKDFIALLVGSQIDDTNEELTQLIKKYKLEEIVKLLGRREDIPSLMANADVFISSSIGEGFPNVLGEAMASGTICVTTDTGDCKWIVNEFGKIVPVQNSQGLANAIDEVLSLSDEEYSRLAHKGRQWIVDHFDIKYIVEEYQKLYSRQCDLA